MLSRCTVNSFTHVRKIQRLFGKGNCGGYHDRKKRTRKATVS